MEKRLIVILVIPFVLFWHWFDPAAKKNHKGIKLYEEKKFNDALKQFMSAKGINIKSLESQKDKTQSPESEKKEKSSFPELLNNTASTLYQLKKYKEALEEFSKIDPEKSEISKPSFYYNLGNTFYRANQFDKALECYKKSLLVDSQDINTKKNYELTLKKLKDKKKKEQKDDKNKNDDQKKQTPQKPKKENEENG